MITIILPTWALYMVAAMWLISTVLLIVQVVLKRRVR